ncbi:MAG: ABC transporter permease [Candidatus Rokuibacteriota bacterium]
MAQTADRPSSMSTYAVAPASHLVDGREVTSAITRRELEEREIRAVRARRRRELITHNAARVAVFIAVLVGWHLLAGRYDSNLLPGPLQTYAGLVRGWKLISAGAVATLVEIGLGFGLGVFGGLVLGSIIGVSKTMQGVLHPFLVLYQAVPKTGLAPMIVLILGFGILPKVVLAAMTAVFPVLENTIIGVERVEEDSLRLFRGLGASRTQIYFKLRLVNALPYIMTGLRGAIVLATVSVVVTEFVAGRIGLGAVMMPGYAQLDTPMVFGALLALTAIGLACYFTVCLFERLVLRWFNLELPVS